ncbi:hypothetical protein Q8F55_001122 [Vanrija albida]|uniref:Protein CPL1-like domain-containing protein n=1 Tax=Vanrija albida TaxID=181172 RepID=A0ABR3QFV8_9TREE
MLLRTALLAALAALAPMSTAHVPQRQNVPCGPGLTACPVFDYSGGPRWKGHYECVAVHTDIESCGGCLSEEHGRDCTAIENVDEVRCKRGLCVVQTCAEGYVPDKLNRNCEPASSFEQFVLEY